MDKYEFRSKMQEMLTLIAEGNNAEAETIVDAIDWGRVQTLSLLMCAGGVYEAQGRYGDARDVYFNAYDKSKRNKKILYKLTDLAIKSQDLQDATDCYQEYVKVANRDPNKLVLDYKLAKFKNDSIDKQIDILENLKKIEYTEKSALELAMLYNQAGMIDKCVEECDEIFLWFTDGEYVEKALKLKNMYRPLTVFQQDALQTTHDNTYVEKTELQRLAEMILKSEFGINADDEVESEEDKSVVGFDNVVVPGASIAGNLDMNIDGLTQNDADDNINNLDNINKYQTTKIPNLENVEEDDSDDSETYEDVTSLEEDYFDESNDYEEGDIESEDYEDDSIIKDEGIEEIDDDYEELDDEYDDDDEDEIYDDLNEIDDNKKHRFGLGAFFADKKNKKKEDISEISSDEYIAENVEYQSKEVGEEGTYEKEEEAIQLEAPVYDEEDKQEIKEAAKVLENNTINSGDYLLSKSSQEELEAKLEQDVHAKEDFDLSKADLSAFNLREEIQAGLAKIESDEKENILDNQKAIDKEDAEMTEITPESISEKSDEGRFKVEERYNLDARSKVGLDAGLSETERRIFSYFVPVRGMSDQLVDVLSILKNSERNGSSKTGNLAVTGASGSGKTKLAVNVVKVIQKEYNHRKIKLAVVRGRDLNGKNIPDVINKVYGGALIIEKAHELEARTISALTNSMAGDTGELIILLEDNKENIETIMNNNKEFADMFSARLDVPKFVNDELVTFAQTYAKENGYRVQEMAILAIYNRIDMLQRDDHAVTVAEVAEIMDEAFEKSKKNSLKRTMTNLFKSNDGDKTMTLLMEEDFE